VSLIAIYRHEFTVPAAVVDANGHVNNVAYVQWMQDLALRHAAAVGCTRATLAAGATWVARSHRIEYLRPAFLGEPLVALTWVTDFRKVRSLRKYKFVRPTDQAVVATGETEWVFVNATTGRPQSIPATIVAVFELIPHDREP